LNDCPILKKPRIGLFAVRKNTIFK
jgi:hypothetical protein